MNIYSYKVQYLTTMAERYVLCYNRILSQLVTFHAIYLTSFQVKILVGVVLKLHINVNKIYRLMTMVY
jgi:hypothetical protein